MISKKFHYVTHIKIRMMTKFKNTKTIFNAFINFITILLTASSSWRKRLDEYNGCLVTATAIFRDRIVIIYVGENNYS